MSEDKDALELLHCAQINFDNFVAAFPLAADHPYYKFAKLQLDEGIEALEETP